MRDQPAGEGREELARGRMRDLLEHWLLKRTLLLESLEARFCFSATALGTHGQSVVLIDKTLPNDSLLTRAILPGGKTILYDGSRESAAEVLTRTTQWAQVSGIKITSISLLAHASAGKFELGNEWVSNKTLDATAQAWESLGQVMARGGSINLFGCNLASPTGGGATLINRIAGLTGTGVHASNNLTGRGGDWVLEAASTGASAQTLDAPLNLAALAQWNSTLAPGITVTPTSPQTTTEAGGIATFDIVLDEAPGAFDSVTIPIASSNTAEGTVSATSVTFDVSNWNIPQTVTVTGVDDTVDDGDQNYNIVAGPATSTDPGYDGIDPNDVAMSNTDDDTAGITVTPISGLATSEAGSDVTFDVLLNSQPTANVTINLTSSDLTEGTVSTSSLIFTAANWNVAQTVTVSSVDDAIVDGDITFSVVTSAAISGDPLYSGMNPSDVTIINRDNDPNGVKLGGEFQVNTTTSGSQSFTSTQTQSIAMDASGNYVVTWASNGQDGSGWGVYARTYDYAGNPTSGEFLVNTMTSGDQLYRAVTMDAAGNFIIAWSSSGQDGSGWGVYAQRFNASGVAQGGEFRVNQVTAGDQMYPTLGVDGSGNFIVAWTSYGQDGSGNGVYARRFNSAGVALGSEFRVNTTTSGDQDEPSIAVGSAGSFVVSWTNNADVWAQRYNAAGAQQGGEFGVNTNTFKTDDNSTVAMDSSGNFVIVWNSNHQDSTGNRYGIFGQRFNSAGAALGSEFQVNTFTGGNQRYPSIAMAPAGDFVVAWASDSRDGSGWGVFGQQYQSDGSTRGGEFRINTYTSNDQSNPAVAMDATGDYAAVWQSDGQDASFEGIYGQRYEGGNDAPVNNVPGAQSVNEDAPLTFSSGNGNLISISDVDAGAGSVRVTLTVSSGTLTLSQLTGLSFTVGDGISDASMSFTGILTNINAALDGLGYLAISNYSGADTLQITTNDLGNSGWGSAQSATDSVAFTVAPVNDAPTVSVPAAQTMNEDGVLTLSSGNGNLVSIADIDAGASAVRVTLTGSNGVLTLATLTGLSFVTGDGAADATMSFTGALANINAALAGMTFAPTADFNGMASVQVVVNDQGNTGGPAQSTTGALNITVSPVNDAPVTTVPGAQVTNEDTDLVFSPGNGNSIGIADIDAATNSVEVTLVATQGTLTLNALTGLTFVTGDGVSDGTMVIRGQLTDLNAALSGLTFSPVANYNGAATIQVTTDDLGNSGSGGAHSDAQSIALTINAVNDAPAITLPAAQSTSEDTNLVFTAGGGNGISIDDIDVAGGMLQVTLSVAHGTLSLSGTTGLVFSNGDGSSDGAMTLTGSLADINAALEGMTFSLDLNYNGPETLNVTVDDRGNLGAGGILGDAQALSIDVVAVNDAPVNTVPAAQTTSEDAPITFSIANGNSLAIFDLDASGGAMQVTLSAADGTLTLGSVTGLTFTAGDGAADGMMTFTGTLVDINAALEGLVFSPTANFNGATTISFSTSDLGNTGLGGALVDSDTINVNVDGLNDAPVNTVPPAQATYEDVPLVFSTGNGNAIAVDDSDATTLSVTLTVDNGTLTLTGLTGLTFIAGDGSNDATMTFTGTPADINAALDGLSYNPVSNYNGPATLQLLTSDLGQTGVGGTLTDSDTVAITVDAVNDPPVNIVPGSQSVKEDNSLAFNFASGNRLLISDLETGSSTVRVTLTATNGLLRLAGTSGLVFKVGDGTGDATMTFRGTINQINAAMEGLSFQPLHDFAGAASVQISTNDRGHTGLGGPLTTTDTIAIDVTPVNDAPVATETPGGITYTENDPATVIDPAVQVGDVDDTSLNAATIAIVGYVPGEDVLQFADQNGISGSWDAQGGVLTLMGTASLADYQAALQSIKYVNASDNPTNGTRSIIFVVGDGALRSDPVQRNVTVIPVNDQPTATPLSQTVSEDAGRTTIDLRSLFADAEDPDSDLSLAIIGSTNKGLFDSMQIDPQTGQLVLDSEHDAFGAATITVRATDTGGLSVETTLQITVAPVNDAPVVTVSEGATVYSPDALGVVVDSNLQLNDIDSMMLTGGTVRVMNPIALRDELTFVDQNGITGSYDAETGTLSLTGTASVAEYESALRSVTYTSHVPGSELGEQRGIVISVNDGVAESVAQERVIDWPARGSILPPIIDKPTDPPSQRDLPAPPTQGRPTTRPPAHGHASQMPGPISSGVGTETAAPVVATPAAPVQLPPPPAVPPPLARAESIPAPAVTEAALPPPSAPPSPVVAPPPSQPVYHPEMLWKQLDALSKELDTQTRRSVVSAGSVAGMTTTLLSVSYVVWCLRGGSLVATLLTTLPLWKWLDPLPVLDHQEEEDRKREAQRDEDEERLRSMME